MKPEITIVIPTLGFETIKSTINSILKYKGKTRTEIIVVGNVKEKIMKPYEKIKHIKHIPIHYQKGDLSKKKNTGFQQAKADIVAFIDDDAIISQRWLEKSLKHFRNKKVGIISGPGITPEKAGFLMRIFGHTLSSLGAGPIGHRYKITKKAKVDKCGDKVIGCNMIIKKEVYQKIGGFNPEIIPGEELDFAARAIKARYISISDPEVYVIHYAKSNFYKFFRQIFRFGKTKIETIKRGSQPFKFIYLLPLLTVVYFPILLITSFFNIIIKTILASFIAIYLIFVLIASIESVIRNKDIADLTLIITIPYMHLAYGIGELYGFLKILINHICK